jgi:hypothetical protein
MSVIEILGPEEQNRRQYRIGHFLAVAVCIIGLVYGLNLRNGIINATTIYDNIEVGISIAYPQNWLLDTEGDYVFRARDMTRLGYKTTLQVQILPVGADITERNILDNLDISRPLRLSFYQRQSTEPIALPDDVSGTAVTYTFVDSETNKFLETVPSVVRGRDILVIRGGQAVVITFRSAAETFDEDIAVFNRLLNTLEF